MFVTLLGCCASLGWRMKDFLEILEDLTTKHPVFLNAINLTRDLYLEDDEEGFVANRVESGISFEEMMERLR